MNHLRIDRRLITRLGLMSFYFYVVGCGSLDLATRKSARQSSLIVARKSADAPEPSLPPAPPSTSIEQSASTIDAVTEVPQELEEGLTKPNDVLSLSVTSAVTAALTGNLHLQVIESLPDEVRQNTEIERARFDTSLNTNAQYMNGNQQVASALQAVRGGLSQYGTTSMGPATGSPNLFSVEKRFSTGTTARVGLGSTYNMTSPMGQYLLYNPAYQSAASMVVEQALFRGASREANLMGIRIAQTNEKQSAAEFQTEVNQTLADVQRAYWMAWLAESQLQTSREFVEQSEAAQALELARFQVGDGGIVQAAQATENLQSLKAELAQARQRSRAARNRLFTLMGISLTDQRTLKLTDEPTAEPVAPDLDQGLALALQQRPEIQVRQLQVAQAQMELDRRKNNERPDVRVYAGYSLTGLNSNALGSFSTLGTGNYGMASLGLRYTHVLGQRAEQAAAEQAQLAFIRQTRARQETEFLIQQQVRDAFDAVNSSWEVWRCQQERVVAARVQADTFSQLHAVGKIDLDRLLRARQQLSSALQQSHAALIDYNLALSSWRFATGTMTTTAPTLEPLPGESKIATGTGPTPE